MKKTPLTLALALVTLLSLSVVAIADADCGASHGSTGPSNDIVDIAVEAGSFNTLAAALGAADLVDVLKGDGPFTVFAPTDEAFDKLPEGTVASLLRPENKHKLQDILKYHVVSGNVSGTQAAAAQNAETVEGTSVSFAIADGRLTVNGVNVVSSDIGASNGTIHVIDNVLLPN